MIRLFRRGAGANGPDISGLGASVLAVPVAAGMVVPLACVGLVFDARGNARRVMAGQRVQCGQGESARLFHPGPYVIDVAPYECAPEIGLRFALAVDSPDPRITQQRFDLYLMAEAPEELQVAQLQAAVQGALQRELAQEKLLLPPCTSLDEWNAFRRGVNELIYTRFGMIVDDCVPVDLAESVDFAALLAAREAASASHPGGTDGWIGGATAAWRVPGASMRDHEARDAQALRRLFLELPCVMAGLRLALGPAQVPFAAAQALLARLDTAALAVDTMPALAWSAPSAPLGPDERARRAAASGEALEALDEAWALLARLRSACAAGDAAGDDADRIVANLETALAARRLAQPEEMEEA